MSRAIAPWATVVLIGLASASGSVRAASGDDIYFVTQQVYQPAKPTPGKPASRPLPMDILCRTDEQGHGLKELYHTQSEIRGMSVSLDGTQFVSQEVHRVVTTDHVGAESKLVVLHADGTVVNTIDVEKLGVRVFGSPVFLPDGKHLGLAVCTLPSSMPPWTPAPGKQWQSDASEHEWDLGLIPSQPFVATLDLNGQNLKRIGPGLGPCWSPDGQTIVYTDYTFEEDVRKRTVPRLRPFEMAADGKNPHAIAPEKSAAGCFSADGKTIVFVANFGDAATELFTCDATGASPQRVKAAPSAYISPRWLGSGAAARLQVISYPRQDKAMGNVNEQQIRKSVWSLPVDGSAAVQVSAPSTDIRHKCAVDADMESMLFHLATQPTHPGPGRSNPPPDFTSLPQFAPPGAERMPNIPKPPGTKPQPVPAGETVQFSGTRVYFRDANGNTTTPPDGYYQLPDGRIIHVVGGQNR